MQMIEVLIAMTSVVSHHAANQALLVSLAEPFTEALAAWLSTFSSETLGTTDAPEPCLSNVPSSVIASAMAQSPSTASKNMRTAEESRSAAAHAALHDSTLAASKPAPSALTAKLKGPKQPSLLTARLKGPKQPSLLTAKLKGSMPNNADTQDPPQGTVSAQRAESSKKSASRRPEDGEVQLARKFIYHLLLHLPVEALRDRQDLWMEHALGLPDMMQSCLGVAVMQASTVSRHRVVGCCCESAINQLVQ